MFFNQYVKLLTIYICFHFYRPRQYDFTAPFSDSEEVRGAAVAATNSAASAPVSSEGVGVLWKCRHCGGGVPGGGDASQVRLTRYQGGHNRLTVCS